MKKTISCNISGMIFNMEETAYDRLGSYLESLKNQLANTEGKDEIYADIELRIAELFSEKLSSTRQVINDDDVSEVINILGKPEDYIDEQAHFEKEEPGLHSQSDTTKAFMRDPDNGIIAGVCAGISAYFKLDLTLVRAIFVLLFFLTGFGLGMYIILWIIAPKAQTSADKLRMQGKPINVDTLKQEFQEASDRVRRYSKSKDAKEKIERVKEKSGNVARTIGRILGLMLIIGSAFGIIAFLTATLTGIGIFVSEDGERLISLYEFSDVIFRSGWQSVLGWTGLMTVVLIPLVVLLVIGVSLLLRLRNMWTRYTLFSLLMLWFVGLGLLLIVGVQIGREFNHEAEIEQTVAQLSTEELTIYIPEDNVLPNAHAKVKVDGEDLSEWITIDKDQIRSGFVELKLETSPDSLFHIRQEFSSRGITYKKALSLAGEINHKIEADSNQVTINPFYTYPAKSKLRGQHVTVFIQVPAHGKIKWIGNENLLDIDHHSHSVHIDKKNIRIEID
jgi:phage shock protein PspC (stress-responsive transcriptional regulator)